MRLAETGLQSTNGLALVCWVTRTRNAVRGAKNGLDGHYPERTYHGHKGPFGTRGSGKHCKRRAPKELRASGGELRQHCDGVDGVPERPPRQGQPDAGGCRHDDGHHEGHTQRQPLEAGQPGGHRRVCAGDRNGARGTAVDARRVGCAVR